MIERLIINKNKQIMLVREIEHDNKEGKDYILNLFVVIENELITANIADTSLFFAELKIFSAGSEQNVYFSVKEKNKIINLQLTLTQKNIYISKAESLAMIELYHIAKQGASLTKVFQNDSRCSIERYQKTLSINYRMSFFNLIKTP